METQNRYLFKTDIEARDFMEIVIALAESFLKSEANILTIKTEYILNIAAIIELKNITSMISIEDQLKMTLAFSFDDKMLQYIFEKYSEGLGIAEEEYQMCLEETAGDMINIVLGRALGRFVKSGMLFNLSPPIIINNAKSISRYKDTQYYNAILTTEHGSLSILIISPGEKIKRQILSKE